MHWPLSLPFQDDDVDMDPVMVELRRKAQESAAQRVGQQQQPQPQQQPEAPVAPHHPSPGQAGPSGQQGGGPGVQRQRGGLGGAWTIWGEH